MVLIERTPSNREPRPFGWLLLVYGVTCSCPWFVFYGGKEGARSGAVESSRRDDGTDRQKRWSI